MRLRELHDDDYEGTAAVLVRNGLRRPSREQWDYLSRGMPHDGELAGIARGWVLDDGSGEIVGAFRNIPFLYEWNGRPVRVAVASAWAVDGSHRHQSLSLATAYFKQTSVDVLLNTTAVASTSGKAFLAFRAEHVPQPSYTSRMLWITGYKGFTANLIRQRRIPGASMLQYPAACGVWMADVLRGGGRRGSHDQLRRTDRFDERFDACWAALRQRANRLQAVRNAATLAWRFALEAQRPTVIVLERDDRLLGYIVLVRRDQSGLRRLEVADLQAVNDDGESMRALMSGALRSAAQDGIHVVALSGCGGVTRRALIALKPHVKTVPGWPLYYKVLDPSLKEPLRAESAWDLSLYDGDSLWSGVFEDGAAA